MRLMRLEWNCKQWTMKIETLSLQIRYNNVHGCLYKLLITSIFHCTNFYFYFSISAFWLLPAHSSVQSDMTAGDSETAAECALCWRLTGCEVTQRAGHRREWNAVGPVPPPLFLSRAVLGSGRGPAEGGGPGQPIETRQPMFGGSHMAACACRLSFLQSVWVLFESLLPAFS